MLVSWPKTIEDARRLQDEISKKVVLEPLKGEINAVGGVDALSDGENIIGCVSVFDYRSLRPVEETYSIVKASLPYIPGYLTFREGPAMLSALERLSRLPDILIFDGQGIAHPRGSGIATHLGVLLETPSIGCAKKCLVGKYREPSPEKGSWEPLIYQDKIVGAALVTRRGCKPVFISPGHRITLEESLSVILNLAPRYRIPEPIRAADSLSRELRKERNMT